MNMGWMIKSLSALAVAVMLSGLTACSSTMGDLEDFARCARAATMLNRGAALNNIARKMEAYVIENRVNLSRFELGMVFEEARHDVDMSGPNRWISIYNSSVCVKLHEQGKVKFQDIFG